MRTICLHNNRESVDLCTIGPYKPSAASDRLGWAGLQAVRYREATECEIDVPPLSHHSLVLITRPPEELNLRYEGIKREIRPNAGSINLVPAGSKALWRWSGVKDSLHIYLEPQLLTRVSSEEFGLDPARIDVPLMVGADLPHVRAAMLAVDSELTSGGAGGRLAAESLANVLAVQLIRHVSTPHLIRRTDGSLPRKKLAAVVEYIMENLDANPTLEEMAAVVHLSPFHFARQFKTATGLPPHQYVIARRIERAKKLMREEDDLSLAQVALNVGFSDQSQFTNHFKRMIGVTPGQFRMSARIA
jgi:AraC family transcriptional regulator